MEKKKKNMLACEGIRHKEHGLLSSLYFRHFPKMHTKNLLPAGDGKMQPWITPRRPCPWKYFLKGEKRNTDINTKILSGSEVGAGSEQTCHRPGEEPPGEPGERPSVEKGCCGCSHSPWLHGLAQGPRLHMTMTFHAGGTSSSSDILYHSPCTPSVHLSIYYT